MTDNQRIDFAAIRTRDAEYDNPESIAGECPLQAMDDRRELLLAYDRLAAAARKVTCDACNGSGNEREYDASGDNSAPIPGTTCSDCADLRRELEGGGK